MPRLTREDVKKYGTEEEQNMLLGEKKLPTMIKRFKNKKKKVKEGIEKLEDMGGNIEIEPEIEVEEEPIEIEGESEEGLEDEEDSEGSEDDLLAELIVNSDSGTLEEIMNLIQDELDSRNSEGGEEGEEIEGDEEAPAEEIIELEDDGIEIADDEDEGKI